MNIATMVEDEVLAAPAPKVRASRAKKAAPVVEG